MLNLSICFNNNSLTIDILLVLHILINENTYKHKGESLKSMQELIPVNIIFLDIDGVLNRHNIFRDTVTNMMYAFNKKMYVDKVFDIYGVHVKKIKLLKKIISESNSKVVLCSSWRFLLTDETSTNTSSFCKKILSVFKEYEIEIHSITPQIERPFTREDEINMWLLDAKEKYNFNVENYIILDDNPNLYPHMRNKHLVQTSNLKFGESNCNMLDNLDKHSGLNSAHVKQALEMLNIKKGDNK